jgi:hypothetical protein
MNRQRPNKTGVKIFFHPASIYTFFCRKYFSEIIHFTQIYFAGKKNAKLALSIFWQQKNLTTFIAQFKPVMKKASKSNSTGEGHNDAEEGKVSKKKASSQNDDDEDDIDAVSEDETDDDLPEEDDDYEKPDDDDSTEEVEDDRKVKIENDLRFDDLDLDDDDDGFYNDDF